LDGEVHYYLDGQEIPLQTLRARGEIGFLTDGACLLPWLSVDENLRLPSRLNPHLPLLSPAEMDQTLEALQLQSATLLKRPHELSFGMRRRVALARVLLHKPHFLFLDEAFTGLDPRTRAAVAAVVREYVSKHGAACLLVTHELETAAGLGDDHTVMSWSGVVNSVAPPVTEQRLYDLLGSDAQASSGSTEQPSQGERLA